jgi:phosphoglycolate phosphatase
VSQRAAGRPVGFDLDNTLIDSNPQVLASFRALAAETGRPVELAVVESRLGLKLEDELTHWFPPEEVTAAAACFRRHYLELTPTTRALPGAVGALACVRAEGVTTLIITAKHPSSVGRCCAAAGLEADETVAFVHGPEKAVVLERFAAAVYVGDTPADMAAAGVARAVGVGVATGSFSAAELVAAGAQVTLSSLTEFPAWYARWRADPATVGPSGA